MERASGRADNNGQGHGVGSEVKGPQPSAQSTTGDVEHGADTPPTHYPETEMEFATDLPTQYQRFADLRESILLDYGYHTARAYWADLQDWFLWAVERDKDPLDLSPANLRQYVALLRRRGYAESTIRRRKVTLGKLGRAVEAQGR